MQYQQVLVHQVLAHQEDFQAVEVVEEAVVEVELDKNYPIIRGLF
jgi:hypothetical protein